MAAIGFEIDQGIVNRARGFLYQMPQRVCVSKPALGELTMKMAEIEDDGRIESYESALGNLRQRIQDGSLHVSWVRDFRDGLASVMNYFIDLRRRDNRLDATDALIIACAMADEATVLYSTDGYVHRMPLQGYTSQETGLTLKEL